MFQLCHVESYIDLNKAVILECLPADSRQLHYIYVVIELGLRQSRQHQRGLCIYAGADVSCFSNSDMSSSGEDRRISKSPRYVDNRIVTGPCCNLIAGLHHLVQDLEYRITGTGRV